jgi:ABC-type transport system involved in multi-copper enzyme maturation permease subunit
LIWTIAAREILDNLMSLKFLFGTLLCLALVVISTVVSLHDYQRRIDEHETAIANYRGEPNFVPNPQIYRKPEILSIFVRGFEKRFGNVVNIDDKVPVQAGGFMGTLRSAEFSTEFSSIDFLFVVKVILSLLAIFLSYDAISGEYELGTLKLALSRPVFRSSIILGKLISGIVCLLIPLIISLIVGILIVQLIGGIPFTSEDWLRTVSVAGVATLCVMSFYMLGMAVSSKTRQAAMSLVILLLIWVGGVFLAPGITTTAVDRHRLMMPTPDKDIAAIKAEPWDRMRNDPLPNWYKEPEAYAKWRVKWNDLQDEANSSIWKLQRQYLNRLYSQADLVRWICRISPSESCTYAAETMARTDVAAYRSFMRYARSYQRQHREFIKSRYEDEDRYNAEKDTHREAVLVPAVALSASFRAALPDVCLLVVFNALFFMLSILFFVRYDVH